MSQLVFQTVPGNAGTPDHLGWWGKLSPTGRYLVYGNWSVNICDLWTGAIVSIAPVAGSRHQNIGWVSDTEVALVAESTSEWYKHSVIDGQTRLWFQGRGWNKMSAADGHWYGGVPECVYDGRAIQRNGQDCYGGVVAGRHFLTASPADNWQQALYTDGEFVRFFPPVSFAWVNKHGDCSFTPPGPALISLHETSGIVEDVTLAPSRYESAPVIVRTRDGEIWLWSFSNNGPDEYVMGRRYGEKEPIVLHNFPGLSLDVVEDSQHPGAFLVVGHSNKGWLQVHRVFRNEARERLKPYAPPFPRPLWCGAFFQYSSRYGDDVTYPSNCTVVVNEPGQGTSHIRRAMDKLPVFIDTAPETMAVAAERPDRVLALYIGDTGGWQNAERLAAEGKERWKRLTGRTLPVLWYITPDEPREVGFQLPPSVDLLGPQFYFDSPDGAGEQLWRMMGSWIDRIGTSKPWIPIFQAYDRNFDPRWTSRMSDLAALTTSFMEQLIAPDLRVKVVPPAVGVLFFAVQRPGGVSAYPVLREVHEAVFRSIPAGPGPSLTGSSTPQTPTGERPRVTIEGYASHVRLGERARAVATLSGGPATTLEWLWRTSATNWTVDARNPASDLDHSYIFSAPGEYDIAVRAIGPGGVDQTGARRIVRVESSTPPPPEPVPVPEPEPTPVPVPPKPPVEPGPITPPIPPRKRRAPKWWPFPESWWVF